MVRILLICLFVAGCGRGLSDGERRFAETIYGDTLATDEIRIVRGALIGNIKRTRPVRPRVACRERIAPPPAGPEVTVSTAAFVLGSSVFYAERFYQSDFLAGYPDRLPLSRAMLLAHELTHIWQAQNRKLTGFSPFRAVLEHQISEDPYLFNLDSAQPFLSYPFEQQASIIEEYVCCRALDPKGARTERLRELLAPQFPTLANTSLVARQNVQLVWKDAPIGGICR